MIIDLGKEVWPLLLEQLLSTLYSHLHLLYNLNFHDVNTAIQSQRKNLPQSNCNVNNHIKSNVNKSNSTIASTQAQFNQ